MISHQLLVVVHMGDIETQTGNLPIVFALLMQLYLRVCYGLKAYSLNKISRSFRKTVRLNVITTHHICIGSMFSCLRVASG